MTEQPNRKLAVLVHADVDSSTSLVQLNETLAHQRVQDAFRTFSNTIDRHNGIAHEIRGDALVAEFSRASDAISASLAFQSENEDRNTEFPDEIRPVVRIGISMGEVVVADSTVTGEGVVLAQRLEQLAAPGEICIQDAAYQTIPKRLPFEYRNLGECELKGFDEPVRAYLVRLIPGMSLPEPEGKVEQNRETKGLPEKPSIAVLPFTNMSGDPEQEYFVDGIVEDIITSLSRFNQLFVIARNSSFTYKGRAVDVRQVADDLGVRFVLEGSARKSGSRLRITGQLIDATTGGHLWADRFDGVVEDVFEFQDKITETVVGAIEPTIRKVEIERARRKAVDNLDAYDLYLKALPHVYSFRPDRNLSAIALLNEAIELEPSYAQALAHAAWCIEQRLTRNWPPFSDNDGELSVSLARRAIASDSDDATALVLAGFVLIMVERDYVTGLDSVRRAAQRNPGSGFVNFIAGTALLYGCEPEEALDLLQRSMALGPLDPSYYMYLMASAWAELISGRPDEALTLSQRSIALYSEWDSTYWALIPAYIQLDRLPEAQAALAKYRSIAPDITTSVLRQLLPFRYPEPLEMTLDGLRKAGLPE